MAFEDDVIDPELNEQALEEAIKTEVSQGVTVLELLNGKKIKIRYKPQSIATMMEAANGTPTRRKSNDFRYKDWAKEVLKKLNSALLNVKIVDDIGGDRPGKGEIPLSLIPAGEYYRLYEACFPGYADDPKDSRDEAAPQRGKAGKRVPPVADDPGE